MRKRMTKREEYRRGREEIEEREIEWGGMANNI